MKALAWLVVSAALTLTAIRRLSRTSVSWPCAVRGHNDMLIFGDGGYRLFLRCDQCGRETPGWSVVTGQKETV